MVFFRIKSKKVFIALFILFFAKTAFAFEKSVIISEFLPNPTGPDRGSEWIELQNLTGKKINLKNWFIKDKAGKIEKISKNTYILPYSFFVLNLKTIAINNNGESLTLFNNKSKKIFSIEYQGKAKENKSFSRLNSNFWQWTIPSPGKKNILLKPTSSNIFLSSQSAKISQKNINFWLLFIFGLFFSLILAIITSVSLNKLYKN